MPLISGSLISQMRRSKSSLDPITLLFQDDTEKVQQALFVIDNKNVLHFKPT
jgi:hypothetical protein